MKNRAFSGGLSTRLDEHLIGSNEAVIYENIDNFAGSLTPVKKKTDTAITIDLFPFFFIDAGVFVSSNDERHYVEYNKRLYFTEPATFPQKTSDGIAFERLGIEVPTTKVNVAIKESAPEAPTGFGTTLVNGNLTKNTLFQYKLVNVTASGIFSLSFTKTVKSKLLADTKITLKEFETFDNKLEVYRRFEGIFRLVGTALNDTDTVVDDTLDISGNQAAPDTFQQQPIGTYQYTYTFFNSTDGTESGAAPLSDDIVVELGGEIDLTNLEISTDPQVDKRKIYRIGGNLNSFTLVDTISNLGTTFTDSLGDTEVPGDILETLATGPAPDGLRFLIENNAIFFGAVGRRLHFTNIDKPNIWPDFNFIDFERDITGIGVTPNGLLVFDKFKTWIISGTDSSVFTRFVLSRDQGCLLHDAIASISDTLFWPSNDGICASNGGKVIVITKDKLGKIALNPVNAVVHDEVYYLQETDGTILALDDRLALILKRFNLGTEKVFLAEDVLYGIENGTLHTLFTSNDNEIINYKSPKYIEDGFSEHKLYKNIYVHSEGNINIKVFVDDDLAQEVNFSGAKDTREIKVNHDQHRGYSLQFEITGTGTIFELENKIYRRANAR